MATAHHPVAWVGMGSAMSVLVLLTLALYIFAVLGVELLGKGENATHLQAELAANGHTLDVDGLFGTIPRMLVTLMQLYNQALGFGPMPVSPPCWSGFGLLGHPTSRGRSVPICKSSPIMDRTPMLTGIRNPDLDLFHALRGRHPHRTPPGLCPCVGRGS